MSGPSPSRSTGARWILISAAVAGASGVILGAYGAHGLDVFLESRLTDADLVAKGMDQFLTGTRYHLLHAVGLLALSCLNRSRITQISAALFIVGILLFSGSLYALVLSSRTWFGAIAPIGGSAWILGWILLAFAPIGRSNT